MAKTRKATDEELAKYREMTAPVYEQMRTNLYGGNFSSNVHNKLSKQLDAALVLIGGKIAPTGLRIIVK